MARVEGEDARVARYQEPEPAPSVEPEQRAEPEHSAERERPHRWEESEFHAFEAPLLELAGSQLAGARFDDELNCLDFAYQLVRYDPTLSVVFLHDQDDPIGHVMVLDPSQGVLLDPQTLEPLSAEQAAGYRLIAGDGSTVSLDELHRAYAMSAAEYVRAYEGSALPAGAPEEVRVGLFADGGWPPPPLPDTGGTPPDPGAQGPNIFKARQAWAIRQAGYDQLQTYRTQQGGYVNGSGQSLLVVDFDPGHYGGSIGLMQPYFAPYDAPTEAFFPVDAVNAATTWNAGNAVWKAAHPRNNLEQYGQRVLDYLASFGARPDTGAAQTMWALHEQVGNAPSGGTVVLNQPMAGFDVATGSAMRAKFLEIAAEARAKNVTLVVPSCLTDKFNSTNPGYQETVQFIEELKAAGVIVVGTSLPATDARAIAGHGQGSIGNPTLRVDTWEHSGSVPIVAHTVAMMKQVNPNITPQQLNAALLAGTTRTGYLYAPDAILAAGAAPASLSSSEQALAQDKAKWLVSQGKVLPYNATECSRLAQGKAWLGQKQSDEFDFTANGKAYVGQFFEHGFVYVEKPADGRWTLDGQTTNPNLAHAVLQKPEDLNPSLRGKPVSDAFANAYQDPIARAGYIEGLKVYLKTSTTNPNRLVIGINEQDAIFQFARTNNLGVQQSDPYSYTANGRTYIVEVFGRGLVVSVNNRMYVVPRPTGWQPDGP